MKTRFFIIIVIVLVATLVGFYYYISINGFSTYHAGINIELLSEKQLERFSVDSPYPVITKDDLTQFPQIQTMVDLLLEERGNPQKTRSFFVSFDTYRIFISSTELKIQNHMSDSGASKLYGDFTQKFGSNVFVYDRNYFSISSWIA